ncbi:MULTISPECIES: ABC transporter ATP-binding protein [unclassified Streptomyces]|uniref:ABC transporter ATP-binding protein n=1 Tax=unclassified Streptomyces TaxID=2593676 RepID=UPI002E81D97B|nr:ABC transporter ATP-binding protein [Streptomyces sp. NBC_00589]WTI42505.1 ABC transporter ATP-binding protein [Streptomyces sp. NBC_00775]WUB33274.1 ABC transporter ATP-binding protein [Streptomyces sp. NBC_00589]
MSDLMLDFRGVGLTYPGGTTALESVDLQVRRGEFVAVVGPSGCGKSSLLRIASGLGRASEGEAIVDAKRLGYVFQEATLLPWLSVLDNVALFPRLTGAGKPARRERARAALATVGLDGFEDHLPHQLSGGMRMRVSLARSLTLEPDLFLFDEPFGALDELTRQRLGEEVLRLFAEMRFAGVFVTHSVSEALYLSTRVIVMSGRPGRVVDTVDVPFGIERDPGLRFTAEFGALSERISTSLREGYAA